MIDTIRIIRTLVNDRCVIASRQTIQLSKTEECRVRRR